jgi:penicillin amidase
MARAPAEVQAGIPTLSDSVVVVYDDRGVPHVFARAPADAQRALGYVVARDRLFQLELQARATAGRLTEWAGPVALDADRGMRRLGLSRSADREYQALRATAPEAVASMEAFAEGVNAWIDRLTKARYPLEYHLLQVAPGRWRPEYSLYLLKRMSWTLSFSTHDRRFERIAALVGEEAARALIPRNSAIQEPIVPNGSGGPRFDPVDLPAPATPVAERPALSTGDPGFALGPDREFERAVGSNNWAVAPTRSASGATLLAGDPHLQLTLPAIWYEAHLNVPDMLDVYGATLLGVPAIVVGFNRDVAWSFTNNSADVIDYYRETVDIPEAPGATQLDGGWVAVERTVETYRDRLGNVIARDTILTSHRGPLFRDDRGWLSMRWLALESSGTVRAVGGLNTATTVDDWLRASEAYDVPSQNGLVADRTGRIAVRSLGQVPRRPSPYRFIWDGTTSSSDWTGTYPTDRLPFAIAPAQGFLASANQQPVDPGVDSTYWGRRWPTPWRAMRINEVLRQDSTVSVEDMRRLQTDPSSPRARHFASYLVVAARLAPDSVAGAAGEMLAAWDGRYTAEAEAPILFEMVMTEIRRRLWDELRDDGTLIYTPPEATTAWLMTQPQNPWWDDRATPNAETRDDILQAALAAGWGRTVEAHGPPGDEWQWSRVRRFSIDHLLRLPGFGVTGVFNNGGPSTLSPMGLRGSHGASWRMVVELGDTVRAWTTYPGGQSGNPASARYTDRLEDWSSGRLEPVHFPTNPADLEGLVGRTRLLLVPESDR